VIGRNSNTPIYSGIKHKNIEEGLLKTDPGRIRIRHLENDVTKALLNVFQHCSKKVLATLHRQYKNVRAAYSAAEAF